MRILVTGSEGFIGSAVYDELVADGHDVIAVDLLTREAHGAGAAGVHADVRRLDVREATSREAWAEILAGVDVVCHQAALVGVEPTAADLPGYAAHNDLGTATLLAAMTEHDVRAVVLASSMVVYGEGKYSCVRHGPQAAAPRGVAQLERGRFENLCPRCGEDLRWEPIEEDAPLLPRSGYAASKVAQEHYAAAWARQTGGRAVALRYHNVYGPRIPRDSSYCGVAARFRSSLEAGESPRVFEDGRQTRDFVHVDDVARANSLACKGIGERAAGALTAYNIASGQPASVGEVARVLAGEHGIRPETTGEFRLGDVRHVVAAPDAAARDLGFRAMVSPGTGLRRFASEPLRAVAG